MKTEGSLLQFSKHIGPAAQHPHGNGLSRKARITERELRESEERYEAILTGIEEGYFEADLAGNLVFFNELMCTISGYSKDRFLGMNMRDFTDPETARKMCEFFDKICQTGRSEKVMEFQIIRENGSRSTLEVSVSLIRDAEGHPKGFRGFVRGVIRRKEVDEALKESENRYRSLFEESLDAIVITDRKGRFVEANRAALDLFGFSREETSRISFKELYADPRDGARFKQEMIDKGFVQHFEVNLKKRDGKVMTCVLFATAKRNHGGEVTGYQGIIREITKTKATEKALQQSEEKYRQLVNHAPAGIYEVDFLKRAFVNVNDVMCEYTGYTREELLSLSPFDILSEESKTHFIERMTRVFSGRKSSRDC